MLILNNRIEYLVCDDVTDSEAARRQVRAAFGAVSSPQLTSFCNIIEKCPKLIVQNTSSITETLYKYEDKIVIIDKTEQGVLVRLQEYANEYMILDDIAYTSKNRYELDIYHLDSFLFKDKINALLRKKFLDEIFEEII